MLSDFKPVKGLGDTSIRSFQFLMFSLEGRWDLLVPDMSINETFSHLDLFPRSFHRGVDSV